MCRELFMLNSITSKQIPGLADHFLITHKFAAFMLLLDNFAFVQPYYFNHDFDLIRKKLTLHRYRSRKSSATKEFV